jgi:hypothetical protein
MANKKLATAKAAKNDEFYTQWADIEREVQAYLEFDPDVFRGKTVLCPCDDPEWSNFTKFFALHFREYGLKKFISTSYAHQSKPHRPGYQPSLFEMNNPQFDEARTEIKGKVFVLENEGANRKEKIDIDSLKWNYMAGNGDFRSEEVLRLRDEADVIVTNPPFSLFREFLAWIVDAGKRFLIIGSMNAITYKEVFPLIKGNKIWLGNGFHAGNAFFSASPSKYADGVYNPETGLVKFRNCCWLTNLDHGRRHRPLPLMTRVENLRFSKHKEIQGKGAYGRYMNYDAIEVPFSAAVPSDYGGAIGVPISFLEKHCPEQWVFI